MQMMKMNIACIMRFSYGTLEVEMKMTTMKMKMNIKIKMRQMQIVSYDFRLTHSKWR